MTLHLWTVPRRGVPGAVLRMGRDRGPVRRTPGLRFAKLLGTGDGRTFTVRDADPLRWGLLATWADAESARRFDSGAVVGSWERAAHESLRLDLRPVASRGTWGGRTPFGEPVPVRGDGPVAALTRARLRASSAPGFWRAVPPVSAALGEQPGLRAAVGIGEAPVGLQGTFSLWDSAQALKDFARAPAHAEVVARTEPERWYAEELFARFAVRRRPRHPRRPGPARVSEVVELGADGLRRRADEVLDVYAEAMGVARSDASSRRAILANHLQRDGLRAVGAVEGDRLLGVAYGYLGAPGQWWHDQVRAALTAEQSSQWLDGAFEVCELHVRPELHGTGLGKALVQALLAGTDAPTAVLTTPDGETRARGFYRAGGWVELQHGVRFPGDPRSFAVLALPL